MSSVLEQTTPATLRGDDRSDGGRGGFDGGGFGGGFGGLGGMTSPGGFGGGPDGMPDPEQIKKMRAVMDELMQPLARMTIAQDGTPAGTVADADGAVSGDDGSEGRSRAAGARGLG